jgi:pimeloyl-ACP methyl ester carboxylesterase
MKKKTLLLCFIHGFKGDDDTFDRFPFDLKALVSHALPQLNIESVVYPRYETRGDLAACVARFREWLQTRVIDLEVAAGTQSPTIDPSVRTVLVTHSMGGIVAADTLLSIIDDQVVKSGHNNPEKFMFPYIQGILAFDTPYLGLSPAIFAHGADTNLKTASSAISQVSALASGLFATRAATEGSKALNQPPSNEDKGKEPETPGFWSQWGKAVSYAGAASVLAAGGAVAYFKRDELGEGWGWVSSHLEFVGVLMKGEELKERTERASSIEGIGFANLYTALGDRGKAKGERTFCILPQKGGKGWFRCTNTMAQDEVNAHVSMFHPKTNPWYFEMSQLAKELVVRWATNEWSYFASGDMRMSMNGRIPGRADE